ncbi:MAG: nitrogenase-associated protein [Candidatus Thiodiazotropha endolucinida]|nr:nitrogenase-associated protein [Candidatus Thiodiazotropha endolucinida]
MSQLVFYEKPGCVGNHQQKALLNALGHTLEARDLLSEIWTPQSLRPFFTDKPVAEWFNLSAPQVKSGELRIDDLSEDQVLALMIEEPLLICRPLLQFESIRQSGFVPGPVLDALGVDLDPKQDLHSCPKTAGSRVCEEPA